MQLPQVKGDGKIILSFKENQCVVETEYEAPPEPTPLSREPQMPFQQTIMASSPMNSPLLSLFVIVQGLLMLIGMCVLVGVGVHLVQRDSPLQQKLNDAQALLMTQEGDLRQLRSELLKLHEEIRQVGSDARRKPPESDRPTIETQ